MEVGELFLLAVAHLLLTGLPGAAAALLAARHGVQAIPVLLAVALAASATVGILGFWTFFADPLVGESFSYLVVLGSVLLAGVCLWEGIDRTLLRGLAVPAALWALGSGFLLFLGFAHGGFEAPIEMAGRRFSGPLPSDSAIPAFYADWLFQNGHSGRPPIFPGEWLSSDRPPLQVGYIVIQRTFGWDTTGLNYQVAGVVLQQLWIVGLWALLSAAGIGRLSRALVMVAVLVSGLGIVNGFFVWPKLLPAALLLAAAALIMTPLWSSARRSLPAAALIGALFGLAMMGHGSSVFGIAPLALLAAYRGMPSWRWIGAGIATGAVLLASWAAYQKFEDPPGNRLTKFTLGGSLVIDDRGTLEMVFDSYREAGLGQSLENKGENFLAVAGGKAAWQEIKAAINTGESKAIVVAVRYVNFIFLLPSLGLLLLGPVAMALRRGRTPGSSAEWSFAITSLGVFALGVLIWCLAVFGNEEIRTIVHVGSYLLPILAIAGAVVGLRAALPRFAVFWVALSSALSLALYVPALEPLAGTSYEPLQFALAALALAGFLALALRAGEGSAASTPAGEPAAPS